MTNEYNYLTRESEMAYTNHEIIEYQKDATL